VLGGLTAQTFVPPWKALPAPHEAIKFTRASSPLVPTLPNSVNPIVGMRRFH
jgi:hypothetical protein